METTKKPRVDLELSEETYDTLVADARKNKRALRRQIEWVLDRYAEARKEDGA